MSLNSNNRDDFTFWSNLFELLPNSEVWNLFEIIQMKWKVKGKNYCAQGPLLARPNWRSSLAQPNGLAPLELVAQPWKQGSPGTGVARRRG
jgi:hypothetical protein